MVKSQLLYRADQYPDEKFRFTHEDSPWAGQTWGGYSDRVDENGIVAGAQGYGIVPAGTDIAAVCEFTADRIMEIVGFKLTGRHDSGVGCSNCATVGYVDIWVNNRMRRIALPAHMWGHTLKHYAFAPDNLNEGSWKTYEFRLDMPVFVPKGASVTLKIHARTGSFTGWSEGRIKDIYFNYRTLPDFSHSIPEGLTFADDWTSVIKDKLSFTEYVTDPESKVSPSGYPLHLMGSVDGGASWFEIAHGTAGSSFTFDFEAGLKPGEAYYYGEEILAIVSEGNDSFLPLGARISYFDPPDVEEPDDLNGDGKLDENDTADWNFDFPYDSFSIVAEKRRPLLDILLNLAKVRLTHPVDISGKLKDPKVDYYIPNRTISLLIDGSEVGVTSPTNGSGSYSISWSPTDRALIGLRGVSVKSSEDEQYYSATSDVKDLEIYTSTPLLSFYLNRGKMRLGELVALFGEVWDDVENHALSGVNVKFLENGSIISGLTATTDENGRFRVSWRPTVTGTRTVQAHIDTFDGYDSVDSHGLLLGVLDVSHLRILANYEGAPININVKAIDESFWSRGDCTRDGIIDVHDIATIGAAYGSSSGEPNYNAYADLNSDATVDDYDVKICQDNYGAETPTNTTPVTLDVAAGKTLIRGKYQGNEQTVEVTLAPGETKEVTLDFFGVVTNFIKALVPSKTVAKIRELVRFKAGLYYQTETGDWNPMAEGTPVNLQMLNPQGEWETVATGNLTTPDGEGYNVSIEHEMPDVGAYYSFRLYYAGDETYAAATSDPVTINVEAKGLLKIRTYVKEFEVPADVMVVDLEFAWKGDCNMDGVIDDADLDIIKAAYGSSPGDANWDERADLNHDNKVDATDLSIASQNYGQTAPTYQAPIDVTVMAGPCNIVASFQGQKRERTVEVPVEGATVTFTFLNPSMISLRSTKPSFFVGEPISLEGSLTTAYPQDVSNLTVFVEKKTDEEWVTETSVVTDSSGNFMVTLPASGEVRTITYRARFDGTPEITASTSDSLIISITEKVKPRVPTRLSLSISASNLTPSVGERVSLSGLLSIPLTIRAFPIPFTPVKIYVNDRVVATVRTNILGRFTYEWSPTETGTYIIYASVDRPILGKVADSNRITVTVS